MIKTEKIYQIRNINFAMLELFSEYLIKYKKRIDEKMINGITKYGVTTNYAFKKLLSAFFNLDEKNELERFVESIFIADNIKELDPKVYQNDLYNQNIKIKDLNFGKWSYKKESYDPYEAFVFQDIKLKGFYEIPQVGYFKEKYYYDAILENNNEWMLITPNEIETMKKPIDNAFGNVLTFGLGLGYYPYMVSLKENINKITIVEKSQSVIDMFEKYILPQFKHKEKIKIIREDAFDFMKNGFNKGFYDYVFTDIWHDAHDGVNLFLKMNKYEKIYPKVTFDYWIIDSLLSRIRWYVLDLHKNEEYIDEYKLENTYLMSVAQNLDNL